MSTNQTPNYALSQWEAGDQVLMEDFNADNAKIDAALAQKAEASALAALAQTVEGKARIAVGAYTGDGAESQVIPLPFTPKAVYVCTESGGTVSTGRFYGGLAVTGRPAFSTHSSIPYKIVEIVSGGFKVSYIYKSNDWQVLSNYLNNRYHYIAFG